MGHCKEWTGGVSYNPWVELTLENWLIKEGGGGGGGPRTYKHMVKFTLNQCGTLGIIIYHHALQPMSTMALATVTHW